MALIIQVSAFFVFCFAIFMWARAETRLRRAKSEAKKDKETLEAYEDINSHIFVSNPASFLCENDKDMPEIPINDKGISVKIKRDVKNR